MKSIEECSEEIAFESVLPRASYNHRNFWWTLPLKIDSISSWIVVPSNSQRLSVRRILLRNSASFPTGNINCQSRNLVAVRVCVRACLCLPFCLLTTQMCIYWIEFIILWNKVWYILETTTKLQCRVQTCVMQHQSGCQVSVFPMCTLIYLCTLLLNVCVCACDHHKYLLLMSRTS